MEQSDKLTLALLDHSLNVPAIKLLVEKKFNVVIATHSWTEVIAKISSLKPDVLLMDFRIDEEINVGCKVVSDVKTGSPKTKVIILTGAEDNPHYLIKAFQSGADGYVSRRAIGISLDVVIHSVAMGLAVISPRSLLQKVIDVSSKVVEYDEKNLAGSTSKLSPAELDILKLVYKGLTNSQIAVEQFKSVPTIKSQLHTAYQKLGCDTREEAVRIAIMTGQLIPD
jgi:DNA-binding NarL/FixJ family response regulator